MIAFFMLAAASAVPTPSPTPLRTIVHARVSPLCTALRENIGHAISAVLANDTAIGESKPIFIKMARDYMSAGVVTQAGWGKLNAPMSNDHDSAAIHLDNQRLEQVIGVIAHNLDLIEAQLADPSRFPKDAKTDSDRKLLELRAQLEKLAAQQRQTLDVLNGEIDTRNMDAFAGKGADLNNLFGLNPTGNDKISGTNQQFNGGPLEETVDRLSDPSLKPEEFSALASSIFGRFYNILYLEQKAISALESPLAKNVVETTQRCNGLR